jgi:GT2 family glycosyltransferase
VIIPSKNNNRLLFPAIDSLFAHTRYTNLEVLVADTGSTPECKVDFIRRYGSDKRVRMIEYDYYNFAKINNDVVRNHVSADTEYLLFMNNDIEVLNDAISLMVSVFASPQSRNGSVGVRLHYPDGLLQHLGMRFVKSRISEAWGVTHFGIGREFNPKDINGNAIETDGNTAAFMMTPKSLFNEIGGFNETYEKCFEDVEYMIRCTELGYHHVTVTDAVCVHYEGASRGKGRNGFVKPDVDRIAKVIAECYGDQRHVRHIPQKESI